MATDAFGTTLEQKNGQWGYWSGGVWIPSTPSAAGGGLSWDQLVKYAPSGRPGGSPEDMYSAIMNPSNQEVNVPGVGAVHFQYDTSGRPIAASMITPEGGMIDFTPGAGGAVTQSYRTPEQRAIEGRNNDWTAGPLGPLAALGIPAAASLFGSGAFGNMFGTTPTGGLTSAEAASQAAAGAQGMSLAPGTTTLNGALEAAVGNAGNMSLIPGSLAPGAATSLPLLEGAVGGASLGALAGAGTGAVASGIGPQILPGAATAPGAATGTTGAGTATTLAAIPGFSLLPQGIQDALGSVPLSTAAGLVGALVGATQGQPAPITTSVTPWGPAASGMQQGLAAVQDQLTKGTNFQAPGVPTSPQFGSTYSAPATPNIAEFGNTYTAPGVTAPTEYNPTYTDQYINAAIQGALKPLNDQYSTVTMPAIGTNAMGNGQFGSSRQAIAEALASNMLQQNSGAISAQMMDRMAQQRAAEVLGTRQLNSSNTANYNQILQAIANSISSGQQASNALNSSNKLNIFNTQTTNALNASNAETNARALNNENLWKDYAARYKTAQDQFQYPWNALTAANNIFSQAGGVAKTTNTPLPETPWWQTAIGTGGAAATAAKTLFG